jgi:hypothetical protein
MGPGISLRGNYNCVYLRLKNPEKYSGRAEGIYKTVKNILRDDQ